MANFRITEQTTVKDYMNWLETADDEKDGIVLKTEEDRKLYFDFHKKLNKMKMKIKG
jgi:hypothetical protein